MIYMIYMVEIYLEREDKTLNLEISENKKIKDLLKEMNISISSVIITKNEQVTLEDDIVKNTDKIKILSVVSGG